MVINYFNDSPIEIEEDDQFGAAPFAQSLAKSILTIQAPIGTALAINGAWGSGKSSAVNLIRQELKKNKKQIEVSEFKCWWYRGEEALALAFLQNLHALLSHSLKDKVKDFIPKLGRNLLQAGPVVGSAMALTPAGPLGAVTSASFKFAERFFPKGDTLENTFQKLSDVLKEQNLRYLIIIDDIDRLSPDEALAIFRIVKSVGRLPNVMYLLVFDRELAENAIKERYPSEGPHFLEKIIQASFEIPEPLSTDLNQAVLMSIENICGPSDETKIQRILNLFYDVVAPYIATPRHVVRFQNAISVTWPAIANEISLADFIALETLRLYEPSLFQAIRSNKSIICGSGGRNDPRDESKFSPFLTNVQAENHNTAQLALQRLFPRMENIEYGSEFHKDWDAERRVCIEKHFDTYFRLTLSDDSLSLRTIDEIIERIDDPDFVKESFRGAAISRRSNGTSLVPVLLDELNTHASKVSKEKVQSFLCAIFEIHDEIDLDIDKDKGMYSVGDTSLRYHWLIRRLTRDRFTLDERTELYATAIENAPLGWLVDFVLSVKEDYRERAETEAPKREEEYLTREDVITSLVEKALASIRSAASDGTLLHHQDLIYILYAWRHFLGNDPSEAKEWTDHLLGDSEAVVILAKGFTGESWSHGIGGMGFLADNVATRTTRARIDENTDIIDRDLFKSKLEELQDDANLQDDDKNAVKEFLSAWNNQISEQED
ncbi:MAG: P-loop NTPase fold protein [Candidatus Thiodiazotropha lotti]|nr:P-loop NTPase fold protein [Candidatus Thiodiazotropha lotti]